jgi:uncharacterized protein YdhG (YjbR/CyaY superfamily)
MKVYKNVEEYIKNADKDKQGVLNQVRAIVKAAVKSAEEEISYGMPAFKYRGKPLFYYAAMKGHLGLYPTSGPIQKLKKDLKDFSTSKGCVRIPYNTKLPINIIIKLLKERVKEIKREK